MRSVFSMLDRTAIEVYCYALSADDGSVWRRHVQQHADLLMEVHTMQSADVAMTIAKHGIHVLINLNGYTKGARNDIFAMRPCPVQASYLGFPATSGAQYIDYHITDAVTTPLEPEHRAAFSEHLVYMPHSYFVNDHMQAIPDIADTSARPSRASLGLPEDKIIFANFNQLYKIDPEIFQVWVSILQRVPNSVLWLLRFPPVGEANILAEGAARGLAPGRIVFTNVAEKHEHIRRCGIADLCLDTTLCCGHTTACDQLWSGVPMITMPGDKMCQRVAYSLVSALGMPEMGVHSLWAYEEAAVHLATHPDQLHALRNKLCAQRMTSPLFDTALWTRHFEASLFAMWRRHEAGLGPADIVIPDMTSASKGPVSSAPMVIGPDAC